MIDVYVSAVDQAERFGAVFERDDETAFFYLLKLGLVEDSQIVEVFNTHSITGMPAEVAIRVQWADNGNAVGLFVSGDLIALFDLGRNDRKARWATAEDRALFALH